MNKIIIIRGPLGVGKTTIAKLLAEKINAQYISLDQILKDNNLEGKDGIPVENFIKANDIILKMVKNSTDTFIVDGCFYYQEQIDDLKSKFSNDLIFFSLISDVEKCIERDSQREKPYGKDSAEYVHMITTKIKEGYEIDNAGLSIIKTIDSIIKILDKI
jgi:adenylate kinase family enzyme